jgi:hypothetical protein
MILGEERIKGGMQAIIPPVFLMFHVKKIQKEGGGPSSFIGSFFELALI